MEPAHSLIRLSSSGLFPLHPGLSVHIKEISHTTAPLASLCQGRGPSSHWGQMEQTSHVMGLGFLAIFHF